MTAEGPIADPLWVTGATINKMPAKVLGNVYFAKSGAFAISHGKARSRRSEEHRVP
jgi:hypothetical protein